MKLAIPRRKVEEGRAILRRGNRGAVARRIGWDVKGRVGAPRESCVESNLGMVVLLLRWQGVANAWEARGRWRQGVG